jgi:hypothetical protein
MSGDQTTDEVVGSFIPEGRAVRKAVGVFRYEGTRDAKKLLIVAGQPLMQLSVKRGILGGCQRQLVGLDRDKETIDDGVGLGGAVDSGRTDRQRPGMGLVPQRSVPDATCQGRFGKRSDVVGALR